MMMVVVNEIQVHRLLFFCLFVVIQLILFRLSLQEFSINKKLPQF